MKNKIRSLAIIALLLTAAGAQASSTVIVHPKNANKVTAQDAKEIFLGKTKNFADGTSAVAVMTKSGKAREAFLADVLGKSESQYKSAWAALVFTGKAQPPKEVDSEDEVTKLVASNPNMVGIVDSSKADGSVKEAGK
jgi:hypothetical protein